MQLFMRLVGYPFDTQDAEFPERPLVEHIAFGPYIAACHRQIAGDLTRAQVIDAFTLVDEEIDDHDDVIARLTAGTDPLQRHTFEDIMMLYEQGIGPWNSPLAQHEGTAPASLRTFLGIVDE